MLSEQLQRCLRTKYQQATCTISTKHIKKIQTFTCATSFSTIFPFLIAVVCVCCLFILIYLLHFSNTYNKHTEYDTSSMPCTDFGEQSEKSNRIERRFKFGDKCKMSSNLLNQSPNCLFKHSNEWREKIVQNSIQFRIKNRPLKKCRKLRSI